MKICFIASANSIHSFKWIKYFKERGHEICWISIEKNEFSELENIKFYLLKNFKIKILNVIFNINSLKKIIKKFEPDILHAHYAGVNGLLAALSGFHPFILTAWGSDILIAGKSKMKKPLIKFALNRADLITCDAEHMEKAIIKLGVNSSKIKIIYFGIDTKKFSPGPKDENLIQKLNIQNCPTIISLRSLEPIYDLETLIKAIPLVLKEFPEAKFIVAGRGSEEEKLKSLAKNLKILESIRFVGWIPNEVLHQYLNSSDIYVSTSLSDAGISSSTAEAMACGLPVVITNTGENEKWVKDGENGYLITIKNPELLANKITTLIKDKDLRREFGRKSRELIEEKNNYLKEMAKMEKLYEAFLAKS